MEDKNPVQVGGRLFDVLEYLIQNGESSLTQISAALSLNKSTVHRLLCSLQFMGYTAQDENEKYRATLKIVQLSSVLMKRFDLIQRIEPYLIRLMEQSGETVHLVKREDVDAIYIDKVKSFKNSIQMVSSIGSRLPLYSSGVGKAMLATLPDEEILRIWEKSTIRRKTEKTITDRRTFMQEIEKVREAGYAMDNEENEEGIRCVAAALPVFSDEAEYAFSISAPINRMDPERVEQLSEYILETRNEIMKSLER